MTASKTPVEMYNEMIRLGFIVPAVIDPYGLMAPTAYISVPTTLAFATPPIEGSKAKTDAKLGSRSKRNSRRDKRSKR